MIHSHYAHSLAHPHTQSVWGNRRKKKRTQNETSSLRTLVVRLFRDNRTPFKRTQFSFATDANLFGWIGAFDRRRVFLFRLLFFIIWFTNSEVVACAFFVTYTRTLNELHTSLLFIHNSIVFCVVVVVIVLYHCRCQFLPLLHLAVSNFLLNKTTNEIVNVSRIKFAVMLKQPTVIKLSEICI